MEEISDQRKKINDGSQRSNTAVDLADKTSRAITRMRDKLHDSGLHTVYLECSDAHPDDCVEGKGQTGASKSTAKLSAIEGSVTDIFAKGSMQTTLETGPLRQFELAQVLSGKRQSDVPPMAKSNTTYWETVTRPYEKQLVDELSGHSGPISQADLAQAALKVAGNDNQLAIATLANFTKNMASIERRQIAPDQIDPSVQSAYTKEKIDPIFERMEGFADDPNEKYNKEGTIYHFYGAMLAASQWGGISEYMVNLYNDPKFAWIRRDAVGKTEPSRNDAIKNAAGLAGARIGASLGRHDNTPSLPDETWFVPPI